MKKLAIIVSSIILAVSLAACNKQVVDLTYSYERAIISLPIFFLQERSDILCGFIFV